MKCDNFLCVNGGTPASWCKDYIDIRNCETRKMYNRITKNPIAGIDGIFREELIKYREGEKL